MYLVMLKPEANQALKGLFLSMVDNVQRYFGCKDDDLIFHPEGMTVPARPMIIDTTTNEEREQEGELTIPYNLIEFWFHYESDQDDKRHRLGFTIPGHGEARPIDLLGTPDNSA